MKEKRLGGACLNKQITGTVPEMSCWFNGFGTVGAGRGELLQGLRLTHYMLHCMLHTVFDLISAHCS